MQGFGITHDSGVIACDYSVVAGGTTVAAAVPGGGRVHRDRGAQVLHSGDLFLAGVVVSCALIVPRPRSRAGPRVQPVTGRDVLAPCGATRVVAAGLRQRSRSHFLTHFQFCADAQSCALERGEPSHRIELHRVANASSAAIANPKHVGDSAHTGLRGACQAETLGVVVLLLKNAAPAP